MKVRLDYTAECPDWWRKEIRRWYGLSGLATRIECRAWIRKYGESMDDDLALLAMRHKDE